MNEAQHPKNLQLSTDYPARRHAVRAAIGPRRPHHRNTALQCTAIRLLCRRTEQHGVIDDEPEFRLRVADVAGLPEVRILHFDAQALQAGPTWVGIAPRDPARCDRQWLQPLAVQQWTRAKCRYGSDSAAPITGCGDRFSPDSCRRGAWAGWPFRADCVEKVGSCDA